MKTVSAAKFKATCLGLIEEVRRNHSRVLITKRGVPVAQLVPPPAQASAMHLFGYARGTGEILGDLVEPAVPAEEWDRDR
jgi:prevent-host-death family protein